MDTKTLTLLLSKDKKTKKYFKGVMPRDYLPSQLEKKAMYVINSQRSDEKKSGHWILLSLMSDE